MPSILKDAVSGSTFVQVLRPEYISELHNIIPAATIKEIPNFVPQFSIRPNYLSHQIISVGRISPLKRQHVLVSAFAKISKNFPDWRLNFWGDNFSNSSYVAQVNRIIYKNRMNGKIMLHGNSSHITEELSHSSIFVTASILEGFPLALTEAMSMGLAVIGGKNCSGINSLIENKKNGLLCNNEIDGLATALSELMTSKILREELGNNAKRSMLKFSPENIAELWEQKIAEAIFSHHKKTIDSIKI